MLVPGTKVALHQRNFALLEVLPGVDSTDFERFQDQLGEISLTLKSLLETLDKRLPK